MKKILILIAVLIPILAGCSNTTAIEMANQSQFSVTFEKIDNEIFVANFVVSGFPNEEEFAQINTIIIDSLNAQGLKPEQAYTVNVYSDLQEDRSQPPVFGTVSYQNGAISGTITNITDEQYIELSTQ
jgi:PBP1b-binding outer membrane lipoprotein LpoB